MPIDSAKDLYVANGADLRHWHDVSSDIIKYLKDKINRAAEAVVYHGTLPNSEAFEEQEANRGDVWTNAETGVNLMWNGEAWIPVSLFRVNNDREPIEGSTNGIQSGYIWTALQNFIDDPTIYRIVGEADQDAELADILRSVSSMIADLMQDVSDLNARLDLIPDPWISEVEGNEISRADDGGAYFNSESCRLAQRVSVLEGHSAASLEDSIISNETFISISQQSPEVTFIEASEDLTINLDTLPRTSWMVKYIYIESLADISITFQNATFSDVSEDPRYGLQGYSMYIRCTWIGGKVIVEVLDNSQMAENVNAWSDADGRDPVDDGGDGDDGNDGGDGNEGGDEENP